MCCGLSSLLLEYFDRKFRIGLCCKFPRTGNNPSKPFKLPSHDVGPAHFSTMLQSFLPFAMIQRSLAIKFISRLQADPKGLNASFGLLVVFEPALVFLWSLRVVEINRRPDVGSLGMTGTSSFRFVVEKQTGKFSSCTALS